MLTISVTWNMELRSCKRQKADTIELDGVTYVKHGNVLLQKLSDGTVGPAVGAVDDNGGITIDQEADAGGALGELLTATLPRRVGSVGLPSKIRSAIARGLAAEWRGALDAASVKRCRKELARLEAEGLLDRGNHGQAAATRGDRIAFLTLDGGYCEHEECPALLQAFSLLEGAASQLVGALGCALLTPPFGMLAVYEGRTGYVRHLDNERQASGPADRASNWGNFRVLTAILYLNEPDWPAADGGALRCFDGDECYLEVRPSGGTVCIFPSCVVPHRVMPSRKRRYAISLWFVSPSLLRGTPSERAARRAARTTG